MFRYKQGEVMKFLKFVVVFFILTTYSALAKGALEQKQELDSLCKSYVNSVQNKTFSAVYPFFSKGNAKKFSKDGFEYENLNLGNTDSYIRKYEFKGTNLEKAYQNLLSILAKNDKIVLRKEMPSQNSQDALNLTPSVKSENKGYTCYVRKNANELWIESLPSKDNKFVFILNQKENNTELYYYELIAFDE